MHPLLPGEKIISQSTNTVLTLTNKRVVHAPDGWKDGARNSILLENIVVCRHDFNRNLPLLAFSLLVILLSLNLFDGQPGITSPVLFVAGLFAFLYYFYSFRNAIVIASDQIEIGVPVRGMENSQVCAFLDKVNFQRFLRKHELMNAGTTLR